MSQVDDKLKKEEVVSIAYRLRDELAALRHQILLSDSLSNVKNVPFKDELGQEKFWLFINRFIYSSLTITLNKMMELYEKYQSHIPIEARKKLKEVYNHFCQVGVKTYRNDYCGHIQNHRSKKPISNEEIDKHLQNIIGNKSLQEIGQWIWDVKVDNYENSSCLSSLLEYVAKETEKYIN